MWTWSGETGYTEALQLVAGQAFWLFVHGSEVVPMELVLWGTPARSGTTRLLAGWNAVGPVAAPTAGPRELPLTTTPAHALHPTVYGRVDDAYLTRKRLEPGEGHWLYALDPCDVDLGSARE